MISCPIFAASINPYHSPSEIELVSIAFPSWTSQPSYTLLWSPCSTNIESEWLDVSHYPLQRCNIIIPMMGLNGRTIRVSWDCRYTRTIGLFNRHFDGDMIRRVIMGGYVGCYPNHATYFPHPWPTYQCTEVVPRFLGCQAISVPFSSRMAAHSRAIPEDCISSMLPVPHPWPTYQCTEVVPRFLGCQAILVPSSSKMAAHSPAIPEDCISGMLPVDPFGMDGEASEHWD